MRNGAGVYVLPSGQPVVTGTVISSTVFNALTSDLANALTTSIATDGQTAMAANLPMGGFKSTGNAAGNVAGDSVRFEQVVLLNPNGEPLSRSMVTGLLGVPNATTPLTKYDLSASSVTLRNAAGGTLLVNSVTTKTCDFGLAGSAANGRDQAAAFTINTFIYLYFIWNGTTVATVASAALPATGPTLPSGYTHFAFATVVRWNASSNIVPSRANGASVWYDITVAGVTRILTTGSALVMTAIGDGSYIPAIALRARFSALLGVTHSSASPFDLYVRPTGASNAGQIVCSCFVTAGGLSARSSDLFELPVGTGTLIDYLLSVQPTTAGGVSIDIVGYTIANGDA